jgi:arylsulfatase A-like enzyme
VDKSIQPSKDSLSSSFSFLFALAMAAVGGQNQADAEQTASPERPNIVFIMADDWGWGDLSLRGTDWQHTPNIDRLARSGTDFTQFNVLNPVCSPSRTAVLTGQYPARHSVHQHFASPTSNRERNMPDWLDARSPTLPRFLKQAGYVTAHFGKWHLTNRETYGAPKPEAYGYDEAKVFNGGAEWESAHVHDTADNAVSFIKSHANRPFFINVWLHETHTPHVPTKASMDKWKHLDEQRQVYAAVLSDGDNAVGKILDALALAGVEQKTLVMFSSDNGPESTARNKKKLAKDDHAGIEGYDTFYSVGITGGLRGQKRSLFEGGVRVPFIVRWPGKTSANSKNDSTVFTAVDLLPTLCAAAGVALPAEYQSDGENLLAAFLGNPVMRSRPIFWDWQGRDSEPDWWPRLAVRDGDWKLLLNAGAERVALHHLRDDRAEKRDVSKDHPETVSRLTKLALDWKATLPSQPDPSTISTQLSPSSRMYGSRKTPAANVTPEQRIRALARWDTNHDGFLTLEEYRKGLSGQDNLEKRFTNFDKNGDGKLTREEFVGSAPEGPK